MTALFHISDDPGIETFVPRATPDGAGSLVWAIAETHLANYFLPRECPRVCFRAGPASTAADIERFLAGDDGVIAVERAWLQRMRGAQLYCYQMSAQHFAPHDANAGYWVSERPVVPTSVRALADLMQEISKLGTSLRSVASLWPLHDDIAASSLSFSMIRMRNAAARPQPVAARRP